MFENHMIGDVELELHAEVGNSFIDIGRLLRVGRGGVIPLDKGKDDLINLVAGNIVVAKGILEIRDERYVIRVQHVHYHAGQKKSV